jgi:hypothetical protein
LGDLVLLNVIEVVAALLNRLHPSIWKVFRARRRDLGKDSRNKEAEQKHCWRHHAATADWSECSEVKLEKVEI